MFCFNVLNFDTILNITVHAIINFAIIPGANLKYIEKWIMECWNVGTEPFVTTWMIWVIGSL
jgi:hypothetical protein